MAMAQATQTVSLTSYRHRAAARQNARMAEMLLFQAFLRFSHHGITDCRCIKDGTPIENKTQNLIQFNDCPLRGVA
jgi:hypothetical protein